MVFKKIFHFFLLLFIFCSFSLVSLADSKNQIISKSTSYILKNSYFFEKDDHLEIFNAGIDSINNFSENILVKYKKNNIGGLFKAKIYSNGKELEVVLKNPRNLRNGAINLNKIVSIIESELQSKEDIDLLRYIVANSMLQAVDEYSGVIEPEEMDQFMVETKGSFGGLGIVIGIKNNQLTVISPIDNTPAYSAGVKANDIIKRIDSLDAEGLSLHQAIKLLRGEKGTPISISIQRGNEETLRKFEIIRDIIKIESIESKKLSAKTGYIKINSFQLNSYTEFVEHLNKLRENGINGLVLDLRGNPGGLLDQSIKISNIFLENKLIVSTRGKDSRMDIDFFSENNFGVKYNGPVIVLIDSGSASASEIVAGALKNNNRAIVIGENSFGKGTVQEVYEQADGAAIKLTIAEYLNPKNYKVHENGVKPHIQFIKGKVENKKLIFTKNLDEELASKNERNFNILILDKELNEEDDDKAVKLSKKILESPFIEKISFIDNVDNYLMLVESQINNEALEYTSELFGKLSDYNDNEKRIDSSNNSASLKSVSQIDLSSGSNQDISITINNNSEIDIENAFIQTKSENKALDNRFIYIGNLGKLSERKVSLPIKIPRWAETSKEYIEIKLVRFNLNNRLNPKLDEFGQSKILVNIKKADYDFPKLFYYVDFDIKNGTIEVNFKLEKTKEKCEKCYLKVYSKNKALIIKKRTFELLKISNENWSGKTLIKIPPEEKLKTIDFVIRYQDENTNDFFDKKITLNFDEINSFKIHKEKKAYIIKDNQKIFSEPSFTQTILSQTKNGNLVFSSGETNNFILIKEEGANYWLPKNSVEKIFNEEVPKFIKAKIIEGSDSPPKISLTKSNEENFSILVEDKSRLRIINYFINDKKVNIKQTNLISDESTFKFDLDSGRNKISILAIDSNEFKTYKNFYITKDES